MSEPTGWRAFLVEWVSYAMANLVVLFVVGMLGVVVTAMHAALQMGGPAAFGTGLILIAIAFSALQAGYAMYKRKG